MAGSSRTLEPVEMTAALGSGSTALPSQPKPWARAPRVVLGSGASSFEATHQWLSQGCGSAHQPAHRYDLMKQPLLYSLIKGLTLLNLISIAFFRWRYSMLSP